MNAFSAPDLLVTPAQAGKAPTVEDLIRRAFTILEANGVVVSPSKLFRMVRTHVHNSGDIRTAARQLEAYCLSYSDVTGETAIRNVMAARR